MDDTAVEIGRAAYARGQWTDALAALAGAAEDTELAAEDLWRLAIAAYLVGDHEACRGGLERAHQACLEAGETVPAARYAFWLGFLLASRGELAGASGWLARSQRLVEGTDCVEQGWLLVPLAMQQRMAGAYDDAHDAAAAAAAVGERFEDHELVAWAHHEQGRALVRRGQVDDGLALLDEAMVAVTAGECSVLATGQIYCSVIESCREVYDLRRASEWTAALTDWCDAQPGLVTYASQCVVHRSEIMQLHGSWDEALDQARHASKLGEPGPEQPATASAIYQQGEVHRLLGDLDAAEDAYHRASQAGLEPQPGLALLRLAQGRTDAAAAAMHRVVGEADQPLQRARLLPTHVVVLLATGDIPGAREASVELEEIASTYGTDVLAAMAARARGQVELADHDARTALGWLRRAGQVWQDVGAPYESARVRELIGLACRDLGDGDGAALELEAARSTYQELGATTDLARLDALSTASADDHGLTRRELQVLRLVADGRTNRAIATELYLSERTVDRHVSNILTKLAVPSRTAATAYAYEHELL